MFLLPWVLITSYATASARQCKCVHFSLPLYTKQERSLFTARLEQTSQCRPIDWPRPTAGLWIFPYPGAGRRSRPPVAFPACVLTLRVVSMLDSDTDGPGSDCSHDANCSHPSYLCSPSSKIASSPLKDCEGNCRPGGK